MLWVLYSVLSGFFYSTSDAFAKKVKLDDNYIIAWSRLFFAIPVIIIMLFFTSVPEIDLLFWIAIVFLTPLEIAAILLYIKAIRTSPLSLTLPFLSLTPVFLIFTSFVFLKELPTALGIFGILLVVIGAYILNLSKINGNFLGPFKTIIKEKGSLFMIIVAIIFSINANLGKIAILHSNTLFFIAFHIFSLVLILSIMFFSRIKNKFSEIKSNIKFLSFAGIFFGLMMIFHFLAITLVIVPYMVSIKRTSSIFGVLYGHFWFKEKYIGQRLIGTAIMLSGAAVILLS